MNILFRKATHADLPDIVKLLADDAIGAEREKYKQPLPAAYYSAFDEIDADKNNCLIVAELDKQIVGILQLTFINYLTYQGGKRAQIEGVRIAKDLRGKGIGKALIKWAILKSKKAGCHMVQLTTDKNRPESLRFYQDLGFILSHEGLKLHFK